jgi:hypothetical protein
VVGPLSVGTLSCFAFVAATPSVFDTFFWLSSAIHYSPPVALLLLNAVLVARLLVAWRARSRLFRGVVAGLACLSVFFAAGFNEIVTAIGIGLLAIALVFDLVTRRWRCRSLLGLLTVAAVAGLVISYFAPGSSNRRALTMAGDPIKNGLESVGSYFTTLGETSLGLVVGLWFVVALATVAATVRPSKRLAAWTAIGAVCLGAGGPVVTSFGVGFAAGGIELRAQLVPTTLLGLGLALVLVACAWLVWGDRAGLASRWLSIAACLAAAIGLGATATDTLGLIRAEALRGQMVLQRDLAVADAVAAGETDITVLPAPILFAPAGATDISFHPGASNHMEAGYRAYMRVPETTTFVVTQQPMGYCLATPPPPRAGAATCQQLGRAN